jgi:hypothetical protein
MIDDSGDRDYEDFLRNHVSAINNTIVEINSNGKRLGYCATIKKLWEELLPKDTDYVFMLEDDWAFQRYLNIGAMIETLEAYPYLTQMALMRQPVNSEEVKYPSLWAKIPDAWTQKFAIINGRETSWVEHDRFWTMNPNISARWVTQSGWKNEPYCEGHFGGRLLQADRTRRSAYWGLIGEDPWVLHIGTNRKVGGLY